MRQNKDIYISLIENIRWGLQPKCPYCNSTNATAYKSEKRYHCNSCYTSYSVTVGTLFHKTHVDFDKWFLAIRLVVNNPKEISVRKLAKEIGVNKNTACYMIKRIRKATLEEQELMQKLININHL